MPVPSRVVFLLVSSFLSSLLYLEMFLERTSSRHLAFSCISLSFCCFSSSVMRLLDAEPPP